MGWLVRKPHPPPKPDKPQVPPPPPKPQTHVLGVNLQCCEACPYKIKKKLLKLKGVTAVHIDVNKGLVSVTGVVSPSVLINVVKKVNKSAKLVSSTEEEDKKKEEEKKKMEEEAVKIIFQAGTSTLCTHSSRLVPTTLHSFITNPPDHSSLILQAGTYNFTVFFLV